MIYRLYCYSNKTFVSIWATLLLCVACGGGGSSNSSNGTITGPILNDIPDQLIVQGMSFDPISLNDYLSSPDSDSSSMTWTYQNATNLAVEITDSIATVSPIDANWRGNENIVFRVTDTSNEWTEQEVRFTIEEPLYTPLALSDLPVSTALEQGLDPLVLQETYRAAEEIDYIYSYLVMKNGYLVAERYFGGAHVNSASPNASATKSFVSALMGIAIREGFITDLDQPVRDYFPEYDPNTMDPRKGEITIRQMLQMRSGFPGESSGYYHQLLVSTANWLQLLIDFPLLADPGAEWAYSNLSAHTIGVIISMASNMSLQDFCNYYLLNPIGSNAAIWPQDGDGYYYGSGDMNLTGRDMMKFGLLIANDGVYDGRQIVPSEWIDESTSFYSHDVLLSVGTQFRNPDYGYFWWGARVGTHNVLFASGSGGNFIVIVPDLDMIVVTTADLPRNNPDLDPGSMFNRIADLVGGYITLL